MNKQLRNLGLLFIFIVLLFIAQALYIVNYQLPMLGFIFIALMIVMYVFTDIIPINQDKKN